MHGMKGLSGMLLLLAACSSAGSKAESPAAQAVASIQEVKDTLLAARKHLEAAVGALETLVASKPEDLKSAFTAFNGTLDALEGVSRIARDQGLAMQARRDEYLKQWLEQTGGVKNPELRAKAEQRRSELMTRYMTFTGKGREVRRAYAPLQESLEDCRRYLAANLTPGAVRELKEESVGIREQVRGVLPLLDGLPKDLDGLVEQIRSAGGGK